MGREIVPAVNMWIQETLYTAPDKCLKEYACRAGKMYNNKFLNHGNKK